MKISDDRGSHKNPVSCLVLILMMATGAMFHPATITLVGAWLA